MPFPTPERLSDNKRHILRLEQSDDPLPSRFAPTHSSHVFHVGKRTSTFGIAFVLIAGLSLAISIGHIVSHGSSAGFIAQAEAYNNADSNSQTLALLDPSRTLPLGIGGAETAIVDDRALVADVTISDTEGEHPRPKVNPGNVSLYEVRPGDTLSEIAELFGVSVDTVKWANDIDGGISPGDTLVILPISGIRYTVKKGDTLASIVKKNHANLQEILAYNGITSDTELSEGDVLTIPMNGVLATEREAQESRTKSGSKSSGGYFTRPLKSYVRTQGVHGHNGVDLAAPAGTPVMAAASGVVKTSKRGGWNGGYGNEIVIKHPNGMETLYAHESSIIVDVGQSVVQGQVIGYVGTTGKSTGNHLHFEVHGGTNPF